MFKNFLTKDSYYIKTINLIWTANQLTEIQVYYYFLKKETFSTVYEYTK